MPPAVSAVVVSYHSGARATRTIASLRAGAAAASLALEVVVVVNSGDEEEAALLGSVADRVILAERNLGYAGGLNRGIAASRGDIFALANPDLTLTPAALGALAEAAGSPGTAAGPAFFLDEELTFHVPPFEEPHPLELARRRLCRERARAGLPFRRLLRRAARDAEDVAGGRTVPASALAGALLVLSRDTLRRGGAFDEGYPLYYEENEWLRRLKALGGRLVRVGAARVAHPYGQSTRTEPRAADWFALSERRYFTSQFGMRGAEALDAFARSPGWSETAPPLLGGGFDLPASRPCAVALSPLPWLVPFAFRPFTEGARRWEPSSALLDAFGGATWFVRLVDLRTGAPLADATLKAPRADTP